MEIYNNLNYKNIVHSDFSKNQLPTIDKKNVSENISIDSIEINETNSNTINNKKAYDAFKDTNNEELSDMSLQYLIIKDMMSRDGIQVPNFTPENSTKFLPFIDKMKDYAKNLMTDPDFHQYGAMPLTNDFLDFCDSFKEKLTQYGCK
ncbi:hypothetical protein [Clostridium weizhouense]|uniref:Uncharacterized protein n=1 Tax=Clostridium weizhouense TaxID=2859781 RepID=A0ABS7AJA2_9CLOT|nr:hypothetical protein [Clostridium weizhouense]MBW6408740.1 hypothetical protein [Clostridium weizhouense]